MREQYRPPWVISEASATDVGDILEVHKLAFIDGYVYVREPDKGATRCALTDFVNGEFTLRKETYWREAIAKQLGIVVVARLGEQGPIVGVGEGREGQGDELQVTALYVRPRFQRYGIGSAMLEEIISAGGQEKRTMSLAVTRWAPAVDFYLLHDFWPVGSLPEPEPPQAFGIHLEQLEMRRVLE